jgi:hypothetical protein
MNRSTLRIGGLMILIGAYLLHQRGLFIVYHLFRTFTLKRGH